MTDNYIFYPPPQKPCVSGVWAKQYLHAGTITDRALDQSRHEAGAKTMHEVDDLI
jgi:hypothetical protein